MYSENVAELLKKARENKKLTQKELAEQLNLSRDTIIKLEKGTRKLSILELKKIEQFFNISIFDYLDNKKIENKIKGIILAGGTGTRLYPITEGISKQLVPIYDKPMIYYPLSVLMLAGIKDILVITTKEDQSGFKRLLGNGSDFGINLSYIIQPSPDGLAQAFVLGEKFIGNNPCAMILGDNLYYGNGFEKELIKASENALNGYATVFGYRVKDPERFGIMEVDEFNNVLSVEEKPEHPKSDIAVTGLYFYPKNVSDIAKMIKPSARGELEITSINNHYLKKNKLKSSILGDGYTWFDTGTFDSLIDASNMIRTIEKNSDNLICSPEIIGLNNKWLSIDNFSKRAKLLSKNRYGKCLLKIIERMEKNEKNRN